MNVKKYSVISSLPSGSVTPGGWLGRWARTNADGWLLKYAQNKDVGVYGKFWNRNQTAEVVFDENDQTLTLCDYTAYFSNGLVRYANMFPGSELEKEYDIWLKKLLASQDEDGYLGAFEKNCRWQHWLEIFSQSVTLDTLLYQYEKTRDALYLETVKRAMAQIIAAWHDETGKVVKEIFSGHGSVVTRTAEKLYDLTGERQYLDFATEVMEKYGHMQNYMTEQDAILHKHNAVETEHVGMPAMLYEYTGDEKLLEASLKAWKMLEEHLCVDGTPHGGEMMSHVGARINCEHCSSVELFTIAAALARITGEVKFADAAELCMYNAYPAAKSSDGMMIEYSHAPNQLAAAEWNVPHNNSLDADWMASRQFVSSAHEPLCCNVNGPRALPMFIDAMYASDADGIRVMYYGPSSVKTVFNGTALTLTDQTSYPYGDEATFTVSPEKPVSFALKFRIPAWAGRTLVSVNGESAAEAVCGEYYTVNRTWKAGDTVRIVFENPVRVVKMKRPEFSVRARSAVIYRGALLYCLPVDEDWQFYKSPANGPGTDIVSCRIVMKNGCRWNYALELDENDPASSFKPVALSGDENAYEWDKANPRVGLEVPARIVENWYQEGDPEHVMTPGAPINPMRLSDKKETVTLIPYGCTFLRITYLPLINE